MAQSGTTYAVVYGVIGRNVAPEKRSWAMGVAAAAGSFGQFLMVPVESGLIGGFGWQEALFVLACARWLILPLAFGLREPDAASGRARRAAEHAAARCARPSATASFLLADGRLLRLRLPGRVHRRAHAELPEGQGPDARAWRPRRWR